MTLLSHQEVNPPLPPKLRRKELSIQLGFRLHLRYVDYPCNEVVIQYEEQCIDTLRWNHRSFLATMDFGFVV